MGIVGYGLWQLAGSLVHFVGGWFYPSYPDPFSGVLVVTWTIGFCEWQHFCAYCTLVLFQCSLYHGFCQDACCPYPKVKGEAAPQPCVRVGQGALEAYWGQTTVSVFVAFTGKID